jgi:hypothetical protein
VLFPLSIAMEEQRRPPSSKITPVSMKASSANVTLLQQDVCVLFYLVFSRKPVAFLLRTSSIFDFFLQVHKLRKKLWHEEKVH